MDIEERINIVKELIAKREEIDRQLAELFGGAAPARKAKVCKRCQGDHDTRSCPNTQKKEDANV